MQGIGRAARLSAQPLGGAPSEQKNRALLAAASVRRDSRADVLTANDADIRESGEGLSAALRDRLRLDDARVEAMARGLAEIAAARDPIGARLAEWSRPNGMKIQRVCVPLGVIGIIYESRPNVTADAGGVCLKSGNAAILRGGSESARSSRAILAALQAGLRVASLPEAAIQLVPTQDRAAVGVMLWMDDMIDVIIPRGGKSLISRVAAESRIPVLKHLDGICHVYIDRAADLAKARAITLNAKMRRTGVCGSAETLLVDRPVLMRHLPPILGDLIAPGFDIRGERA